MGNEYHRKSIAMLLTLLRCHHLQQPNRRQPYANESMSRLLLEEFRPEVWKSENFLEENVVFWSSSWPFVELVHQVNVWLEVVKRLHLKGMLNLVDDVPYHEYSGWPSIHTSLPVLTWWVIVRGFPNRHYEKWVREKHYQMVLLVKASVYGWWILLTSSNSKYIAISQRSYLFN